MNKVLDLVSAIEDDNFGYSTGVSVPDHGEIDYLINCRKYFSTDDGFLGVSFNHDKLNALRGEYEKLSVSGYVTKGHPDGVGGDDVYRHEVEIQVVE